MARIVNETQYMDQKRRIEDAKHALTRTIATHHELEITIWIAALTEMLSTVSGWNLEAERGERLNTDH